MQYNNFFLTQNIKKYRKCPALQIIINELIIIFNGQKIISHPVASLLLAVKQGTPQLPELGTFGIFQIFQ